MKKQKAGRKKSERTVRTFSFSRGALRINNYCKGCCKDRNHLASVAGRGDARPEKRVFFGFRRARALKKRKRCSKRGSYSAVIFRPYWIYRRAGLDSLSGRRQQEGGRWRLFSCLKLVRRLFSLKKLVKRTRK